MSKPEKILQPEEDESDVRLTPEVLVVDDDDGFAVDIFGYEDFGVSLGKIFSNTAGLRVVMLNGSWGLAKPPSSNSGLAICAVMKKLRWGKKSQRMIFE